MPTLNLESIQPSVVVTANTDLAMPSSKCYVLFLQQNHPKPSIHSMQSVDIEEQLFD